MTSNEPRMLRILTTNPTASLAACHALAGVGMEACGAHSGGIYCRTDDPALAAKALKGVGGVTAVWFANSVHGGLVTA